MKLSDAELRELFQRSTARPEPPADCLSEDELIRASSGRLGAGERDRIAGHIARCSDCAREFRIARELAPIEVAVEKELAPRTPWFAIAAGVVVALSLAAVAWLATERQRSTETIARLHNQLAALQTTSTRVVEPPREEPLPRPQVDVPIVDLDADVTRGASDVPIIEVPATADSVTLILHLPEETSAPIDVELNGTKLRLDARRNRSSITLALHRRLLNEGEHAITVQSDKQTTKFHFRIDYL